MTDTGHRPIPTSKTDCIHDPGCACMQHPDVLYRTIVNGIGDLIVVFDMTGVIHFANRASRSILGCEPDELEGRNVLDFIHPDDHDRALRSLNMNKDFGAAPGLTAFRLLRSDGEAVMVDMTGGHASVDGVDTLFTSTSRINENRAAMQTTLVNLLRGAPLDVALSSVLDIFTWRANGSHIGISWLDGTGARGAISTGIDLDLIGAHPDPDTPWAEGRRTGRTIMDLDLSRLDPHRRQAAHDLGLAAYWIEPVASAVEEPALITVWTAVDRRPPTGHDLGMETARSVVEVILRWAEQQRQLDLAAFHDPLTGLANRNAFFDAVAEIPGGGAVFYCDLDRFKPVNDLHGHAAGDALLQQVAARLIHSVRAGDVVARLGGDEFAIVCPAMTDSDAVTLAQRIRDSIALPFHIQGNLVQVEMSVGLAHDPGSITTTLLDQADRHLYDQKRDR